MLPTTDFSRMRPAVDLVPPEGGLARRAAGPSVGSGEAAFRPSSPTLQPLSNTSRDSDGGVMRVPAITPVTDPREDIGKCLDCLDYWRKFADLLGT